jgi:hypothetical protein
MNGYRATGARPLHQENHRDHHQNGYSQQPEIVNVRQHAGLAQNVSLQQCVSFVRGF